MKNFIKKIKGVYLCCSHLLNYLNFGLYYDNNQNNLSYKILLIVHSIEKGLGIKNTRFEFGKKKILDLMFMLKEWESQGFSRANYAYIYAINILKFYVDYHAKKDFNSSFLEQLNDFLSIRDCVYFETGYKFYNNDFDKKDLISLINNRHSIREYLDKKVTVDEIKECVEIALMSPSACNRQASKCYFSMDNDKINKIGELIPGNTGFINVSNYIIITADISAFSVQEYMQWMTNAGIFIAYLSLIFEYKGINSCILQWINVYNSEMILRQELNIPKNEHIVAALAIGYAKPNCKILQAKRKSLSDVLKEV